MSTFRGRTFMTRGFADKIPVEAQQQIVTILESFLMKSEQIGREIDYLQVFELTVDRAESKECSGHQALSGRATIHKHHSFCY